MLTSGLRKWVDDLYLCFRALLELVAGARWLLMLVALLDVIEARRVCFEG